MSNHPERPVTAEKRRARQEAFYAMKMAEA